VILVTQWCEIARMSPISKVRGDREVFLLFDSVQALVHTENHTRFDLGFQKRLFGCTAL
jgi:hypothetical protein